MRSYAVQAHAKGPLLCRHTEYEFTCTESGLDSWECFRRKSSKNFALISRPFPLREYGERFVRLNIEGPAAGWWRHIVPATQDMFFRCDVISVNAVLYSFQFKRFTKRKLDEVFTLA